MGKLIQVTAHSEATADKELVAAVAGKRYIVKRFDIAFEVNQGATDNITLNFGDAAVPIYNIASCLAGSVYGFDLTDVPDDECPTSDVNQKIEVIKPASAANYNLFYKEI